MLGGGFFPLLHFGVYQPWVDVIYSARLGVER